jgi:hypothetical protein
MMCRPWRYNASTCSWPCESIRIDHPNPRITAAPIGGSTESFTHVSTRFKAGLRIWHILELHRMKPLVLSPASKQLVMGPHFDNRASGQHHDPIGLLNGGQPMGNDDGRSILHQIGERQLDDPF